VPDDNVSKLIQPGRFNAQFVENLAKGHARSWLKPEAKVVDFLVSMPISRPRKAANLLRRDQLPEREVMTEIGPIAVYQPRSSEATSVDRRDGSSRGVALRLLFAAVQRSAIPAPVPA